MVKCTAKKEINSCSHLKLHVSGQNQTMASTCIRLFIMYISIKNSLSYNMTIVRYVIEGKYVLRMREVLRTDILSDSDTVDLCSCCLFHPFK